MAILDINKNPSRTELKVFAFAVAGFFALVGGLLHLQFDQPAGARGVWIAGAGLLAVFLLVPPLRRHLYLGWMYAFFPFGWVLSHVVLGIVYYVVLTPTGLLMRLFGRDVMKRDVRAQADSFWVARDKNVDPARYFRQF